jgi:hypothetical protein
MSKDFTERRLVQSDSNDVLVGFLKEIPNVAKVALSLHNQKVMFGINADKYLTREKN